MKILKKTILLILMLLLFLLPSCSGTGGKNTADIETDAFQIGTSQMGIFDSFYRSAQFGESGVYFLSNVLYYAEGDPLVSTVLCDKPECSHKDSSCNAYVGSDIQLYDGYIYYAELNEVQNYCLYRCSLSGGEKEFVMQLRSDQQDATCTAFFLIHRGYVIFASDYSSVKLAVLGDSLEDAVTLFDVTEDDCEEWHKTGGWSMDPYSWEFWADGDCIYFLNTPGSPWASRPYSTEHSNELYQYDITTGACELVWTLPDTTEVGSWTTETVMTNGCAIIDGQMYFYLSENGLWRQDLDSGELTQIAAIPAEDGQIGIAFFDKTTAYVSTCGYYMITYGGGRRQEHAIYCYNLETGELENTISMADLWEEKDLQYMDILASDGEQLIVYYCTNKILQEDGTSESSYGYCSIDIASGEVTQIG